MKNVPSVKTVLETEHAVKAVPEVIIDWNMNRYRTPTAANTPAEIDSAYDAEFFPIESIIEPNRPTKGINKARVGQGTIADDYLIGGTATPNGRYYIAGVDDVYKYWTSQTPSDASTGALANCKPQVVYATNTTVNKIVITLENTWASPKTFNIQTTTVAVPADGDWTTVATQATTPAGWKGRGQIVLYWDGTDWQNATRSDNADGTPKTTTIRGVRLVVTELEGGFKVTEDGSEVASNYGTYVAGVWTEVNTNGKDAYFDLIEISARLEVDLSQYVISVETTLDMSEVDKLYPIGTLTSNQAGIELSNLYWNGTAWVPGLFNADNTNSPYASYMEPNAKVNIAYNYYDVDTGAFIGKVQEAEMYTDLPSGQGQDTVNMDLTDYSKFLNETVVRSAMWENLTVPEIVWRILDSVGFVKYHIDTDADRVTEHKIPVFYTDGEMTVWEVLDDLAKASQTAIYIDSYGVLQVKTRDFAFDDSTVAWEFYAEDDAHLADIADADITTEFEPNHYKVIYQKTNWSAETRGQPTLQKVWEPEDTVTLRGTPLVRDLLAAGTTIWLSSADVKVWPYEGLVNIEGELIRYKGKQYVYYTGATGATRNTQWIYSQDEYNSRDEQTEWEYRHKNHFSGALSVTERGVWNSEAVDHKVDTLTTGSNYSVRHIVNGTRRTDVAGFKHIKSESKVQLYNTKRFKDYKDILVATKGAAVDSPFYYYGTKFRFVKGRPHQTAGITIHNQGNTAEDAYYIEFTPTRRLGGKERKRRHEMIVYSRVGGVDKRIGGRGAALAIADGIWYEVDVAYSTVGSDHKIRIWVNGKQVFNEVIAGANRNTANGRWGMFMRGRTKVEYEYLYAVRRQSGYDPPDDFSFLDKMRTGYTGQQLEREWYYSWKTKTRRVKKRTNKVKYRYNDQFVDEFGPYVHEVREYDIKFDPAPVLHSRLYLTNDWSACALEYSSDPFGAKFILANTSRANAVIHGEDKLSYSGTNQSVNQVLTVFGRALVIDEAEEVIVKNDDQIRRRGKIESEISSQWIQSKEMAQEIADWLGNNWSYGNDSVSLEVFGNPLIEVGDMVYVNHPDKHLDDYYFVVGIKNTFDMGIKTNLDLRLRT